jgi:hypothetical protein
MPSYLLWRNHREVESPIVGAELDENEDENRMDDMIADVGREYEIDFGE